MSEIYIVCPASWLKRADLTKVLKSHDVEEPVGRVALSWVPGGSGRKSLPLPAVGLDHMGSVSWHKYGTWQCLAMG